MEHIIDFEDRKEIERCIKDKRRAEKKDNLKEVASLCNTIGHIYAKYGQWTEAIGEYETELGLQEALGDTIDAAVACRNLGECYCGLEQFDKALNLQQRHLTLSRSCGSKIEEQRALATIGRTYLVQAETALTQTTRQTAFNSAEEAFIKSLGMCEKLRGEIKEIDYAEMRTRLYLNLGLVFEGKGNMSDCSKYMKQAIGLSQQFNLYDDLYRCQYNLASIYQRACNYEQALKFISQACATAKKMRSKLNETEAMYQKAIVLVQREDFAAARHLLKKCNKFGTAEPEKVKVAYKTAVKMEKIQEELKSLPEGDNSRKQLYEKMADNAVELGNYKHAITYYAKTLSQLKSTGADNTELIPIYVSLAQTYKDDKQYDKALENYHAEIRCRGQEEGDQVCRTWLNIAEVQELQGLEYSDISRSYLTAYDTAKKAKHRKLQVRALSALCELQKLFKKEGHRSKTEEKLKGIQSKYNIRKGADLEDESQDVDPDSEEEEVEMSDLTESEDEEIGTSTKAVQGVGRKILHKRNHLGETPLHRACIEGNLKRVKKLIEEGHPLNPQDNSGWTPLHEASNHNFYEIVEYLLTKGATIDHRGGDQCGGVTPLIDAASCGHVEIMQLLIERGANVLCKDDKLKTALDTILGWQRENRCKEPEFLTVYNNVIELLKEKTPQKGCSQRTRHDVLSQSVTSQPLTQSQDLPHLSRRQRDTWPHRSRNDVIRDMSDSDSDSENELFRKRNTSPRVKEPLQSENSKDTYLNPLLEDFNDTPSATEAYRSAMTCIGSSTARSSQQVKSKTQKLKANCSALIQEDEYVDDWLVDDLQPMKRRKMDVNGLFSTGTSKSVMSKTKNYVDSNHRTEQKRKESGKSVRCRIEDSDIESDTESNSRDVEPEVGSHVQDTVTIDSSRQDSVNHNYGIMTNNFNDIVFDVDSDSDIPCVRTNRTSPQLSKPKQTKITNFGTKTSSSSTSLVSVSSTNITNSVQSNNTNVTSSVNQLNSVPSSTTGGLAGVIRVKVQIKDKLLLIPIIDSDGTKTLSWLSEEASERYYKMVGLRPALTLGTKDGAFFSPDDLVKLVLADNDKIEGYIDSWVLPPMVERYTTACRSLNTVSYGNVKSLLEKCESSGELNLSDLALRAARFQPVIRAFQCQTCLRELYLNGNRIGDTGLENLCKVLDTLPNLSVLDLTCNDITPVGLNHLSSIVTAENKALQGIQLNEVGWLEPSGPETLMVQATRLLLFSRLDKVLTSLKLGHNPLFDGCLAQLSTLISNLPQLSNLGLSSCCLTMKLFQTDRLQLAAALERSHLQQLDLSYNNFGCVGVELLMKCLQPTKLSSLNLSATIQQSSGQVYRHIYNYLSQDGCVLQELQLCDCHLALEDADFLVRLAVVGKNLQKLDVSTNPDLNNKIQQQLIQQSCDASSLEELIFDACGLTSPIDVDFLDAISEKLNSEAPIRKLQFTCHKLEKVDSESLTQIWRERWSDLAQVAIVEDSVKLEVANR